MEPYRRHLRSSADLVTPYEAIRAGFVALALEKNRRADPFLAQARYLQSVASNAETPSELLQMKEIERGLLTAAGVSDKALAYLTPDDRIAAIKGLIEKYLEPAGAKFVEELVFRFLLIRGDSLGGSMRNVGGALAQTKFTRIFFSALKMAGIEYRWQDSKTSRWLRMEDEDADTISRVRGIHWSHNGGERTLCYNLVVPLVKSNVDLCLYNLSPATLRENHYNAPTSCLAVGELKGGIDPAGADEHWKTARSALNRVRSAFADAGCRPFTFFIGASIEQRMAREIWDELEKGTLTNAANLTSDAQLAAVVSWLCSL